MSFSVLLDLNYAKYTVVVYSLLTKSPTSQVLDSEHGKGSVGFHVCVLVFKSVYNISGRTAWQK